MKKTLLLVLCLISISFNVLAREEKDFLCHAFRNIEQYNDNEILEKILLLDDYFLYKKGEDSSLVFFEAWKILDGEQEKIYNISLKSIKNYLPLENKEINKKLIKAIEKEDFKVVKRAVFAQYLPIFENCASDIKSRMEQLKQKILLEEKDLFYKRVNGRKLHFKPLEYFTLINQDIQPSKDFIYKYKVNYNHGMQLRVIQVVPSGVLVKADNTENDLLRWYGTSADKIIFIETTSDYVDKDLLHNGFYEYLGVKSYSNLLGNRTVHSFREIKDPFEDIFFYKENE